MPGPLGAHNWHPMSFSPRTGLVYLPSFELGFPYVADANFTPRQLAVNLGHRPAPRVALPDDAKVKRRSAQGRSRPPGRLGSRATEKSLGRRARCRLEWRRAVDCRQSRVPGRGERGLLGIRRNDWIEALVIRGTGGHRRATCFLRSRQRPVRRGARRLGRSASVVDGRDCPQGQPVRFKWADPRLQTRRRRAIAGENRLRTGHSGGATQFADTTTVEAGMRLYQRFCGGCHGGSAVSGGVLPDLRHSALLANREAGHGSSGTAPSSRVEWWGSGAR